MTQIYVSIYSINAINQAFWIKWRHSTRSKTINIGLTEVDNAISADFTGVESRSRWISVISQLTTQPIQPPVKLLCFLCFEAMSPFETSSLPMTAAATPEKCPTYGLLSTYYQYCFLDWWTSVSRVHLKFLRGSHTVYIFFLYKSIK